MPSAIQLLIRVMPPLICISGCGGGGGPALVNPEIEQLSYSPLTITSSDVRVLSGAALVSDSSNGQLLVVDVTGRYGGVENAILVVANGLSFEDADGPNESGRFLGENGSVQLGGLLSLEDGYDFASGFTQNFLSSEGQFDAIGIIGIVTGTSEMPQTGLATFNGVSSGLITTATSGVDLLDGRSEVTVDFLSGAVDIQLSAFTAIDQSSGLSIESPVDQIQIQDSVIGGSGFVGGNVQTFKDGLLLDFTGSNASSEVSGVFFGLDESNEAPDEVGGVLLSQGDDATILGVFLAE